MRKGDSGATSLYKAKGTGTEKKKNGPAERRVPVESHWHNVGAAGKVGITFCTRQTTQSSSGGEGTLIATAHTAAAAHGRGLRRRAWGPPLKSSGLPW